MGEETKKNVGGAIDAQTAESFEQTLPDDTSKSSVIEQQLAQWTREHGHLVNPKRALGAALMISWTLFIISILSVWGGFMRPGVGGLVIQYSAGVLGTCGVVYATVDYYIRNGIPGDGR